MLIKDNEIHLTGEEVRHVAISPFKSIHDKWCNKHGIEYEYDTIAEDDYSGDLELNNICGYAIFKYDNKYWRTNYYYNAIRGMKPIDDPDVYIFSEVVKQETVVTKTEWVYVTQ